ncbi:amino acid adenylation domain-containing protein [Streptomyces sp. Qhu_M48]|uniref:amino acid adenylation domain-containing protein n=1 Tax=Streptomyces sp. Qhu_M48 TaxID=3435889 RepID=UPI003F501B1B
MLDDALRVAGGFLHAGLTPGSHVVLPADRGEEFLPLFWGALAAGLVPVPLAPDVRRVLPVWEFLDGPPVAVGASTAPLLGALPGSVRSLTLDGLREHPAPRTLPERAPDDVAFLQFSSGSTGAPKGVELTHAAVLANLAQIRAAAGITSTDVLATWMPYFHDMGLIGTHLVPLSARIQQVRVEPLTFAKRPARWLEAAARHRATLLSAANFALALVERRVPEDALARLDLTCVRMILVGAEPISPAVWGAFVRRMRPTGLAAEAPQPVYGLAEATLAVTFPPPGEVARPLALDRAALGRGWAVDTSPGPEAVELMDVGRPVPGCVVRITDDAGARVEERRVGHIEVRGPQLARGYHRAPQATADAFVDGWLRTGDVGFLREGRLCVTGRSKDVVFVDGRTFHAADLEEVAGGTPGLGRGPVAVVGSTDPADGGERVVVFVAPAPATLSSATLPGLLRAVAGRVREALGHDDVRVLAVPVRAFPRTTSGKIRRGVLRERFEGGEYPEIAGRGATGVVARGGGSLPGQRGDGTLPGQRRGGGSLPGQGDGDSSRGQGDGDSSRGQRGGAPAGARDGFPAVRRRDDASSAAPRARQDVEAVVVRVWGRVLALPVEAIGPDDDFRALGGSSLKAMEVLAGLEDEFGVTLRPSEIRDHTTVAALAGLLLAAETAETAESAENAGHTGSTRNTGNTGSFVGAAGSGRHDARAHVSAPEPARADAAPVVAVSALACRFPGADTPEAFWERLLEGYDAVTGVPDGRWADPADGDGRRGAFLDDPAGFDAGFFGIGEEEARSADPQARILLELVHEALERAGHAGPRRRGRRVGVFVAAGDSGYRRVLEQAYDGQELPASALTGNLPNMLAARVAHCLDLTGPALAVDTACSSALVALHLARRSLQAGECDIAVVGGVHLNLTPTGYALLEKAKALSPTGRCHAFGAAADGFVPGEGGAAIVLTRLEEAERAGDPVLAVLRGTAVNNDGRSLSLMAPNPLTQREVITRAYRDAGVDPDSVSYVEAHGTGTPVGDPVEVRSLAHAFPPRSDGHPRLLGSVKTNVGHLLNAAGMPSLVKVVLALGHRRLPPSPLRAVPGQGPGIGPAPGAAPALDLAGRGFALVDEVREWAAPGPLVAGVNAFGFGGTNAHAVLEEAPARTEPRRARSSGPRLLTLSARGTGTDGADGLRAAAAALADHLRDHPGLDVGDVCAAVAGARDEGPHRLALAVDGDDLLDDESGLADGGPLHSPLVRSGLARLVERLDAVRDRKAPAPAAPVVSRARLVFLLPGQGVLPDGQARALHAHAPAFREALEEASGHAGVIGGRTLAAWCLDPDVSPDMRAGTDLAQPLLVAYGVALARQLRAWGVTPDAVAGHSVGEIAAACVAGTLSLGDAVRFAAERGRLMAELCAPGAMAAVRGAEETVAALVAEARGALSVAAVNGPEQVVLAGTESAVGRAVAELTARGIAARRLGVSRAFHSPLVEPALGPLADAAGALVLRPSSTPLISTVTAAWRPDLDPAYLRDHARRPVRFGAAVDRLIGEGFDTFVELGSTSLRGPVRSVVAAHARGAGAVALAAGHRDGARGLMETVGALWQRGVPLDRTSLDAGRSRVAVPTYPFQRRRYWPAAAPRPRPLLHRFGWDDAPLTVGSGPRSVLLAGPDSPLGRAFAARLTERGVTVGRVGAVPDRGTTADRGALAGTHDMSGSETGVLPDGAPGPDGTPCSDAAALPDATPGPDAAALPAALPGPDAAALPAALPGPGALAPSSAMSGPDVVVLLAGPTVETDSAAALDTAHRALVAHLQDLLPHLVSHRPRVLVVTEDVHVTGAGPERPCPTQAVLTGLALALPEEVPGVAAHSVDLSSLDGVDTRLDALHHELAARPVTAPADGGAVRPATAIAWRAGRRLGRTVEPVATEPGPRGALPGDGVYLITGGAGGVGAALARVLAGRGRPTLVLTGRSAEPPAGLLPELRSLGATVEYRSADVARAGDVDALLAGLPRLDVLIHAAGVVRPGTLRAKTPGEVAEVLAAKTRGTHLLARGLHRHGLRPALCLAFSSVASVLPGLAGAVGDYAAANAYLDAFAAAERAAGRPWQAVNFAAFAETGLLASTGAPALGLGAARGPAPLATAEALEALHAACGTDAAHLMVADPRPAATGRTPAGVVVPTTDPYTEPVRRTDGPRPPAASSDPHGAPVGEVGGVRAEGTPALAEVLRRLLSETLGVSPEDLGDDVPLLGLGLDSLMAVDLVKRLEKELDRDLPITLFFEHRTLGELARQLGGSEDRAVAVTTHVPGAERATDDGVHFALTPVQLAFHAQGGLHPDVAAYGYVTQDVRGPLDPDLLGRALGLLADRHAMLRIRFLTRPGQAEPTQASVPPGGHDALPDWYEVHDLAGARRTDPADPAGARDTVGRADPADDLGGETARLEEALCNRPFDLTSEAPIRAVLVRSAVAGVARLVLVVHHAVADGYSLNVLGEELWALYTALSQGRSPELPPPPAHFATYAAHERTERSEAVLAEDRAYWREVLARRGEPLPLPYDGDPLSLPEPPLLSHQVSPDPELSAALREVAAAHGVSLFHLLLAAYARCLSRWSGGREEVSVNVARARRETRLPGIDRLVGPLADTLPVPVHVGPDDSVYTLAARLRDAWPESERHGRITSPDLARLLPPDGAGPRTASPASFSFARFPVSLASDCPVGVRPISAGTASAATRLSLLCWESEGALAFSWNFPARLFHRTTIARLAREHLTELVAAAGLSEAAAGLGEAAASVPTGLPEAAASPVPAGLTEAAASPVPAGRSTVPVPLGGPSGVRPDIVDRLRAQFRATPDVVAVDTGDGVLTYADLDRASGALAARLRTRGVVPGDLVGLLTAPGADTVVGVVGILRAGAGWVPLDAAHPPARLADQLERSRARALVCHAATREAATRLATAADLTLVAADVPSPEPWSAGKSEPGSASPSAPWPEPPGLPSSGRAEVAIPGAGPDSLAYVIFTSGSTGRPKAVPITRRSMTNYLDWALATFRYGEGDRLAQTASVCFDASVRQILAPLLVGATVVTLPRRLLRDPDALLDRVEQARVSVWSSVPSLWSRLLEAAETRVRDGGPTPDLSALRWIHVGGEALPPAHVRRWYDLFGPGHRIANLYGPTEATINATFHIVDSRPADDVRALPIGTPLTGTEVDVVAADGRSCPPGEPGELLISGVGLTPGYLHAPELTAAAFTVREGRRWYRSGDRVRRDADGVLEFLGRLDDQVKIRGHRVEPGEIESALLTHPAVARAAVVHRDERLSAFVECRPGVAAPDSTALRAHLARSLPEYMLPARIRLVDELPLTGTGKIDRARLTAPAPASVSAPVSGPPSGPGPSRVAASEPASPGTRPVTPTELLLARVWSELLDTEQVRREDDFFALGGDSLLVLQVFARLREEIPALSLPRPTAVYSHRTLGALAAAIDRAGTDEEPLDTRSTPREGEGIHGPAPFPLTPSQRGFLLAEAMAPGSDTAWLACLRVDGPLRPEAFQRAVDACVVRHPMLRTVFPAGMRPPVQQELPPSLRLPVDFETLADPGLLASRVAEERERRFEPWAWPLLRLRLLTLGPDEHALLVHAHHLIGDGYSVALLGRELLSAYDRVVRGEPAELPPLRGTFRDHVALQERVACESGARARIDAPYRRPVLGPPSGARASGTDPAAPPYHSAGFTLEENQVAALRRIATVAGSTLFAPVLTAYYRALAATTEQRDLIIGLAVSGRDDAQPDTHRVFGPYAAAVPLRPGPPPGGDPTVRTFAEDLRAVVDEVEAARTHGVRAPSGELGLPVAAQFFFTFLDFSALGPMSGETLSVRWDDGDAVLAPPPVGTDTFLAVRPVGAGEVRVTLRASIAAFPDAAAFDAFADALRKELAGAADGGVLDSALVGYLPPPGQLVPLGGPVAEAASREHLRRLLFPDGRPRLVEEISTPLGRSGFVCLPLFADELASTPDLADRTAGAVAYASALGARCVSLAGMIPSLTAYGFGVLREMDAGASAGITADPPADTDTGTGTATALTTGHAATAVSVVKTVHAALTRTGRELGGLVVAVAGLGSIGSSSLELLLTTADEPPARLLLCDVAGSAARLRSLGEDLVARGLARNVEVHASGPALPAAAYEAGLIVTAVSGGGAVLDVAGLRPGTIVVDDSFPHCFDTTEALTRMRERRDVLLVGGGLLSVGAVERRTAPGLPPAAAAGYAARSWLPGTVASCRLESLLRAARPELPLVHGLVDAGIALAHWRVMEAAGIEAGPLHLLGHALATEEGDLDGFPPPGPTEGGDGANAGT